MTMTQRLKAMQETEEQQAAHVAAWRLENRMREKYKHHCKKAVEMYDAAAKAAQESDGSPLALVRVKMQAAKAEEHRAQAAFYKRWLEKNGRG